MIVYDLTMNSDNKPKRLHRSRKEKIIAGVCGGLAEYFNIDPTIVRLIFALLLLAFGSTLIIYLIMWLVVPQTPIEKIDQNHSDHTTSK